MDGTGGETMLPWLVVAGDEVDVVDGAAEAEDGCEVGLIEGDADDITFATLGAGWRCPMRNFRVAAEHVLFWLLQISSRERAAAPTLSHSQRGPDVPRRPRSSTPSLLPLVSDSTSIQLPLTTLFQLLPKILSPIYIFLRRN